MAVTALSRHAGLIAVSAGVLVTLTQVVGFLSDLGSMRGPVPSPVRGVNALIMPAVFAGLAVAAVALYGWHARRAGSLGALGLGAAVLGTVFAGGACRSTVLRPEGPGLPLAGVLVSSVLFSLGWVLFGVSGLGPRVFPPAACVAVAVGGVVAFPVTPPYGIPLGLAMTWLGASLLRARSARAAYEPVPLRDRLPDR